MENNLKETVDDTNETKDDSDLMPIPIPISPFDDGPDEIEKLLQDMGEERHTTTLFREEILREICAILISESKPNALLIGPAGSGKTNIVEELAWRIKKKHKSIPKKLHDYTICAIRMSDIVAGSGLAGALESKIKRLIEYLEAEDHKVILFLDEVHMLFGDQFYRTIAQMLKPALSRGRFMVIGATTTQEVKKIDQDPAFNRRFTRVLVDELTKEQAEKVLRIAAKGMEKHYGVKIGFTPALAKLLVKTADEFCSVGSHRPDNALTLLDRAVASKVLDLQAKTQIGSEIDRIVLDEKFIVETAFRLISGSSSVKRFDEKAFRTALHQIRGQEKILDDLTNVIKLYDMHLRPHSRPLTFLFAGSSGVGKSEVAKIIASEYIGEKPIILNMTEYCDAAALNRIMGAPAGYIGSESNMEMPFDALETNPYQVILLDEFEKSDRSIQRLFMSIFDEGTLLTNYGKEIDFSKAIIIATTNAGCTERIESIGFGHTEDTCKLSVSDLSGYFDTELISRFSHIYTFNSIPQTVYGQIIRDCMEREVKGLNLDRVSMDVAKQIRGIVTDKTIAHLCEKSYNKKLGARPAKTVVHEHIDNLVLSLINKEESTSGATGHRRKAQRVCVSVAERRTHV